MEPLGSSCYSLNIEPNKCRLYSENQNQNEKLSEIIASTKSLSYIDNKTIKSLLPQIFATIVIASLHIVLGVSFGCSAVLVNQLEDPSSDLKATEIEITWIASCLVLVGPLGALLSGFVIDRIGRLNTLKLSGLPNIAGFVLMALSTNSAMLLTGRILTGLGAAVASLPAVVYITEIARPDMRGALISFAPLYGSLGMVLAYLQGWFSTWRIIAWTSIAYTIVPILLLFFLHESPMWLISKGKNEEAIRALEWLHKYQSKDGEQTYAQLQFSIYQKEQQFKLEKEKLQKKKSGMGGIAKEFCKPTAYKPILLLLFLFFVQQFSGVYVTLFYAVTLFQEIGSDFNPYFASVLTGVVRFLMSIVSTVLLRHFKKRKLMMISSLGMAVCMIISGLFTKWIHEKTSNYTSIPLIFVLLYVICSMVGLLPIPWTMTAELFPLEIRGIANNFSVSMGDFLMFVSLQCYRPLEKSLGGAHAVQFFFSAISLVGFIYVYVFVPETFGKKLSEIEEYFNGKTTIYIIEEMRRKK